jgi:hypothetical protein
MIALLAPIGTSSALDDSVAFLFEKHEILCTGHLVCWALWLKNFTIVELLQFLGDRVYAGLSKQPA